MKGGDASAPLTHPVNDGGGGRTIKFLLPSSNAHCHFYRLGCSFVPYRVGCSFVQSSCFHPLSCNAFLTGTQLRCVWTPPCPRQLAMRVWNPSWILSGSQRCGAAPRSVLTPSVGPHPAPPPQVHSSVLTLTCLSRPLPILPPLHRYSAALRLDPSLPPSAVNARVESVMDSLGLTKIRRSTVLSGTGVSGVSGGERRRVAIAMELVIDPQVC